MTLPGHDKRLPARLLLLLRFFYEHVSVPRLGGRGYGALWCHFLVMHTQRRPAQKNATSGASGVLLRLFFLTRQPTPAI